MSSDESPNASAPRERRDAVREKAQQVQAQQSRARAIRRATPRSIAVVAVVAVAAVVVTWAVSSAASKPLLQPANVTDDGFVVTQVTGVGSMSDTTVRRRRDPDRHPHARRRRPPHSDPTATPTDQPAVDIRVYVDYLSSGSQDFQVANVQQLAEWVDPGCRDPHVLPGRDADREVQRHEVLAARRERRRVRGDPLARPVLRVQQRAAHAAARCRVRRAHRRASSPTLAVAVRRGRPQGRAQVHREPVVRDVGEGCHRPRAEGPARHG